MKFLYNQFIKALYIHQYIFQTLNEKYKKWIHGQENLFSNLENSLKNNSSPIIWIHCASVGEFEQAEPIIDLYKEEKPNFNILVSFFSPSGFELHKNNKKVFAVTYLPLDTEKNAMKFINIVNPILVIFIKYEFWYHYLNILQQKKIKTILVDAIFREKQIFFQGWGGFHRSMLNNFNLIFVQDLQSFKLLSTLIEDSKIKVVGDTRFDQVIKIKNIPYSNPFIEKFCANKTVFIAGSIYESDIKILLPFLENKKDIQFILVPHEVSTEKLKDIQKYLPTHYVYSADKEFPECSKKNILLIDNVGILNKIYRFANMVYIGGGFSKTGIHNILEPLIYEKLIIFGPNYLKYKEAVDLINMKGAFTIKEKSDLDKIYKLLFTNKKEEIEYTNIGQEYINNNLGASKKILDFLNEFDLNTK